MAGLAKIPKAASTPNPPSLRKSTSGSQSSKDQKSILGFFQKKSVEAPRLGSAAQSQTNGPRKATLPKGTARGSSQSLTPAPSSDALEAPDDQENRQYTLASADNVIGLPSPITPAVSAVGAAAFEGDDIPSSFNSPSRKVSTLFVPSILKLIIPILGEEGGKLCRV